MTNIPARGEVYTDASGKARREVLYVYDKDCGGYYKLMVMHKNGSGTNVLETELKMFSIMYKRIKNV